MTLDPGAGLSASILTTADGREIRYVTAGDGGPIVVFEAGMGSCASGWLAVQRLVSAHAGTVAYDRAGHAGSTPDSQPRSLDRICDDLQALTDRVSPGAPVVLVGHSWGGPIIRCFADRHPERVCGIVLVDTSTTGNFSPKNAKRMPMFMSITRAMHVVGIAKPVLRRSVFKNVSPQISREDLGVIDRDLTSASSAKTAVAEAREVFSSLPAMARWESAGLPAVPVVTLMGAGTGRALKLRQEYIGQAQKEMSEHPRGECRVIEGTDHYIPFDKPAETAQAILDVVRQVREG